MKNVVAIITARGGSKRLRNKNILPLLGKPLISYTIEAALAAKHISKIIVSTDCDQIASIAKKNGAEVPFKRPEELSSDYASSADVVEHCLRFLKEQGEHYSYFILLQPTSPLRTTSDIDKAIELAFQKEADCVTSVTNCEHSPLWTNTLNEDLSMDEFINPEVMNKRSQDLPEYYRINGALYICQTERFLQEKKFIFNSKSFAFKMSQLHSIDIDTKLDFLIAESILREQL